MVSLLVQIINEVLRYWYKGGGGLVIGTFSRPCYQYVPRPCNYVVQSTDNEVCLDKFYTNCESERG